MRKYILSLIILLATAPAVKAQESVGRHAISAGVGVAIPTGNNQFIDNAMFVPTVAYEIRVGRTLSAGLAVDYASADKKGEQRVRYDGDLVDGYAEKSFTMVPVRAQLRWFPLAKGVSRFQPYVSLAGGAQYAEFSITGDHILTSKHHNWSGVIVPDAGLRFFPGSGRKFFLDARLSWQWGGNGWEKVDNPNQQAFRIHLGAGIAIF